MPRQCQLPVRFSDNRRCYRSDSSPSFIFIVALVALLSGYACLSEAGSATELSQTPEPGGVLSSGYATAFGDAPRASDEELDRMRGGYIVNLSGLEFLMAFSLERLTFINGELVSSFTFNPFSLTPLTQITWDIAMPSIEAVVPAPIESPVVLADSSSPGSPVADNTTTNDVAVAAATPHAVAVEGSNDAVPPVNVAPATQTAANGSTDTAGASSSGGSSDSVTASSSGASSRSGGGNPQVVSQGNLAFVQNGPGNAFALTGLDANAIATIVQNSLNDQVISTITTLNINLAAQMAAARDRLDALINQGLSRLH